MGIEGPLGGRAARRAILGAAVLLALSMGCGKGCRPAPVSPYVRIAIDAEPSTLDPARATTVLDGEILAKITEGLVRFDGTRITPGLADTWTLSPDAREYRFTLREGITFSDGRPLTSADVAASFRRLLDTSVASPRTWVLEDLEGAKDFAAGKSNDLPGVSTPDARTVVLRLEAPRGAFLSLLAMPNAAILPAGTPPESLERPIGTGPYRFESWQRNERILLLANSSYREGAPGVAGLEFRVIPDALTAWSFFQQGQIDVMEVPPSLRPQVRAAQPPEGAAGPVGNLLEAEVLATVYVAINCEKIPDASFRRILADAVPPDTIIATILNGAATRARGPIPPALRPPGAAYSDPPLPLANIDRTRPLRLLHSSKRAVAEPTEAVAAFLREKGFQVQLESMEWTAMKERVGQGDYDLAYLSWYGDYPDPENFLLPVFHSANLGAAGNRARYRDPGLDRLFDRIRAASPGPARDALVLEAEARLAAASPWIFLWHPRVAVLAAPRLAGWEVPAVYNAFTAARVSLQPME